MHPSAPLQMSTYQDLDIPTTLTPEWFSTMRYRNLRKLGYTDGYAKQEADKEFARWSEKLPKSRTSELVIT